MEPYKLTTNRPPLSDSLGPPGFHPLIPGQCPEDRLTAVLAQQGYRDEQPEYGIDEANDSLFSLYTVLSNNAAAHSGAATTGGPLGAPGGTGPLPPLVASAANLQRTTLSMLEVVQKQRLAAVHEQQDSSAAAAGGQPQPSQQPSTPGPRASPPPPSPPLRRPRTPAAVGVLSSGVAPAATLAAAASSLPELHLSSDVGRRLWVSALAGAAPLGYLAQTTPTLPDRRMMFALLWQNAVPMPRAAWFCRVLYTHLARQQLRP